MQFRFNEDVAAPCSAMKRPLTAFSEHGRQAIFLKFGSLVMRIQRRRAHLQPRPETFLSLFRVPGPRMWSYAVASPGQFD